MTKSVYLAGPDVFRQDSIEWGQYLQRLCRQAGLVGLYPLDNVIDTRLPPRQRACAIAQANMGMIRSAHGVIANLQAFRGAEPDSGTVFEVGMAVALGKPVWAVFPDRGDLRTQVPSNEHGFCQQGWLVEDFGLPRNLMLACTWAGHSATVEEAVAGMAELLSGQ